MCEIRMWVKYILLITIFCGTLKAQSLVFPPYGHSHGIRKAKQIHLFLFLPFARFDDPQGLAAAKLDARDDTTTESDDDELVVYGVNSGRHQIIYNTSMWGIDSYGEQGSAKGQFNKPLGITCDPKGNVFVVDAGNNRIVHLFNPKRKLSWVKTFDGSAQNGVKLKSPSQIGLDEDGMLYVTDTGNKRIVVFDEKGHVVKTLPNTDTFSFDHGPTTLAVADGHRHWSYFREERAVFCADRNGKRIWKIDFNGTVLDTAVMPHGYTANYAAVDYYHNIWISDIKNHCIVKFDHNLALLDIFGSEGEGDNQFIEPRGIAIWKRYGQTFIAEKEGAQYYWIGTGMKKAYLVNDQENAAFTLMTDLSEHSYASLFILSGADTVKILDKQFIQAGTQMTRLKQETGRKFTNGILLLRIEPTYSSYTYYQWNYTALLPPDSHFSNNDTAVFNTQNIHITKLNSKEMH